MPCVHETSKRLTVRSKQYADEFLLPIHRGTNRLHCKAHCCQAPTTVICMTQSLFPSTPGPHPCHVIVSNTTAVVSEATVERCCQWSDKAVLAQGRGSVSESA